VVDLHPALALLALHLSPLGFRVHQLVITTVPENGKLFCYLT